MKNRYSLVFIFLLCSLTTLPVLGQQYTLHAVVPAPAPEHICTLQAQLDGTEEMRSVFLSNLSSAPAMATINVNYINGSDPWPQAAIDAFEFAKGIWEASLESSIAIEVDATWGDLGGCNLQAGTTLGAAGPTFLFGLTTNGQPLSFYPAPLANALTNTDQTSNGAEIMANFNNACDNPGSDHWYFGTDGNVPAGDIDFVSVVLHELGHGLGIVGSANFDDGTGDNECAGVNGEGCLNSQAAFIFDRFAFDMASGGGALANTGTYPNPSTQLGNALTSDDIFFQGTEAELANGGNGVQLYAPNTWEPGSSYSHVDETAFDNTDNALMTPELGSREVTHVPGPVVCGMFADMGWTVTAACAQGSATSTDPLDPNLAESFHLTAPFPNPFNPRAEFSLTVSETQNVRIEVMDILGRKVLDVFAGHIAAGQEQRYTLNGADLPSGTYWIRATGETFLTTRQAVLIK